MQCSFGHLTTAKLETAQNDATKIIPSLCNKSYDVGTTKPILPREAVSHEKLVIQGFMNFDAYITLDPRFNGLNGESTCR